jgi:hypothetical protein
MKKKSNVFIIPFIIMLSLGFVQNSFAFELGDEVCVSGAGIDDNLGDDLNGTYIYDKSTTALMKGSDDAIFFNAPSLSFMIMGMMGQKYEAVDSSINSVTELTAATWKEFSDTIFPLPTVTNGACGTSAVSAPISAPIDLRFWGMFGLFAFIIAIASLFRKRIFKGEG